MQHNVVLCTALGLSSKDGHVAALYFATKVCVISPAGIPVAAFSNLLLAQISLGSGKKARERARVKICPTRRAAMRATMCVFGEIDIFLFLLFSFLARSSLFSRDSFLKPFGVRNETPRFVH